MKQGTQIAYIPSHAKGDINHPAVEFGFVVAEVLDGHAHWCRYWWRHAPGTLRTTTTSELTYDYSLIRHVSVDQSVVEEALVSLGYKEKDELHTL